MKISVGCLRTLCLCHYELVHELQFTNVQKGTSVLKDTKP